MEKWNKDSLEAALAGEDWLVDSREIEHAIQFELKAGVKINLYKTGKLTFGGPKSAFKSKVEAFVQSGTDKEVAASDALGAGVGNAQPPTAAERRVFVVYGHDTPARNELELLLRRIQVKPIILENIPGVGDTLIEKLESLTDADFACVLLTPGRRWRGEGHTMRSQSASPTERGVGTGNGIEPVGSTQSRDPRERR